MGPVPTTSVLKRTSVTANRVFGYAPPLSASPNLETKKPILATTASRQEDEDNVPAKPSVPAPPPVADPSLETKKPILVTTASRQEDEVPIIVFENDFATEDEEMDQDTSYECCSTLFSTEKDLKSHYDAVHWAGSGDRKNRPTYITCVICKEEVGVSCLYKHYKAHGLDKMPCLPSGPFSVAPSSGPAISPVTGAPREVRLFHTKTR